MAKSSDAASTIFAVGGVVVVGYIVIKYVLPSLQASTVRNQSAGLFGLTSGPGGTTFSAQGNLSQLLAALTGNKQQQQQPSKSSPSLGAGGGPAGGGIPVQGLLPPSNFVDPLQEEQLWLQASNQDLNNYLQQPGQNPSFSTYDSSGLDSIQLPEQPVSPLVPIDLPSVPISSSGFDTSTVDLGSAGSGPIDTPDFSTSF
jgi:hypothetical protein